MIFAISHELKGKRDYSPLFEKIMSLGEWMHYIKSVWVVETREPMAAHEVFRELDPYIDDRTDFLFIVEVTRDYFGILPKDAWEWLNQRNWQQQSLPV